MDIRSLKAWATRNLPRGSKLREIIILDEDRLTAEAFLAKMQVWLTLCDLEHGFKEKQRIKQDVSETYRASEACPFCSTDRVTLLDNAMRIYCCSCGGYWRNVDHDFYWLKRLSVAEASDKIVSNNEEYRLYVEQLKNSSMCKSMEIVLPETLEKARLGILKMMRCGELMAFLTPDGDLIFAHIEDKTQTQPYSM